MSLLNGIFDFLPIREGLGNKYIPLVYGSFLGIYTIVFAISMPLFWLKRKQYPLKARYPKMALIAALFGFLLVAASSVEQIFVGYFPCKLAVFVPHFLFTMICAGWTTRSIGLVCKFRLLQAKRAARFGKFSAEEDQVNRWARYKLWANRKFLLRCYAVMALFHFMVFAGMAVVQGTSCSLTIPYMVILAIVVLYVMCWLFAAWQIRKQTSADGFGFIQELKLMVAISLLTVLLWVLFNFVPVIHALDFEFHVRAIIVYSGVFAAHIISVVFPLVRYREHKLYVQRLTKKLEAEVGKVADDANGGYGTVSVDVKDISISLEDLLRDEEGRDIFRAFMESEFAIENLAFWEEAMEYMQSVKDFSRQRLLIAAKSLAQKYLQEGRVLQLDLSGSIIDGVLRPLGLHQVANEFERSYWMNSARSFSEDDANAVPDPESEGADTDFLDIIFNEARDAVLIEMTQSFHRFKKTQQFSAFELVRKLRAETYKVHNKQGTAVGVSAETARRASLFMDTHAGVPTEEAAGASADTTPEQSHSRVDNLGVPSISQGEIQTVRRGTSRGTSRRNSVLSKLSSDSYHRQGGAHHMRAFSGESNMSARSTSFGSAPGGPKENKTKANLRARSMRMAMHRKNDPALSIGSSLEDCEDAFPVDQADVDAFELALSGASAIAPAKLKSASAMASVNMSGPSIEARGLMGPAEDVEVDQRIQQAPEPEAADENYDPFELSVSVDETIPATADNVSTSDSRSAPPSPRVLEDFDMGSPRNSGNELVCSSDTLSDCDSDMSMP